MSARSQLKRKATSSKPSTVIEISDSDDDSISNSKRSKEDEADESFQPEGNRTRVIVVKSHDSQAKEKGESTNSRRFPSKKRNNKKTNENIAPNATVNVDIDSNCNENIEHHETPSHSQDSSEPPSENTANGNDTVTLPPTIGRSSFWERRKVWSIHELLAETEHIDTGAARNIVQLFENENTIPFICRYRRDMIAHLPPEKLRDIKNTYTEIVNLRKKAENIVTQLEKENKINEETRTEMLCAKNADELEFLVAPYKSAPKGSLADRAKALGLEVYANRILYGEYPKVVLERIVDKKNPGLDSIEKVREGICQIISHTISNHTAVLEELRRLRKVHRIQLESRKTKEKNAAKNKEPSCSSSMKNNKTDQSKYEQYFEFQTDVKYLKPHQVLAINRGEKSKFLTVKLLVPDYLKRDIKKYINELFLSHGLVYQLRLELFEKSFEDCYTKKLQPLLSRQIRSELNVIAKKASIDVFAKNLKQLLLMSPLKGKKILGIDPGFSNGCKLAVISETSDVLETGVIYPHARGSDPEQCGEQLAKLLARHNCKIIALGNGTACRETEFWLTTLFEHGILDSSLIHYSIVSEQGASIYSCSDIAKKEFPSMDVNEISAVSIARRLNDPLSEYVKIEPRHIGVGMYQHDINEKSLSESLNEVVSECVSYVGVDINTASLTVLKHIAGLTEKRADKIIKYRMENGAFRRRKDLLKVNSIGEKTFVQCAGFIRIEPRSLGEEVENLLDCTWVHPESYTIAKKIISRCNLRLNDIGKNDFIEKIKEFSQTNSVEELASDFDIPKERVEIIFEALQRKLFQDYRSDVDKQPLFKQGITRITDISVGDVISGAVTNVTHFGAFVDVGVETDGLIHTSKMNGIILSIGDRINVSVTGVDINRRRLQLRLEELL